MATFRRDRLLRLAEKGKLVMTDSYHFDDMAGAERSKTEMPVKIIPVGDADWWKKRVEGVAYLRRDQFEGNCGRAWTDESREPGRVILYVHSNCNYTFRIVEEKAMNTTETAIVEAVKEAAPVAVIVENGSRELHEAVTAAVKYPAPAILDAKQVTLYFAGGMMLGNYHKVEARGVGIRLVKHAQYDAAVECRFVPKGARAERGFVQSYHPTLVILAGWGHPDPESAMGPAREEGAFTISAGRHSACSPEWDTNFAALLDAHIAKTGAVVLADYRDHNPYGRKQGA